MVGCQIPCTMQALSQLSACEKTLWLKLKLFMCVLLPSGALEKELSEER